MLVDSVESMMMHGLADPKFTGQIRIRKSTQHSLEIFHTVQPILVSVTLHTLVSLYVCLLCCLGTGCNIDFRLYIPSRERVALCELIVKDDLFQLVEVFAPWILEHTPGYTADM